MTIRDPAREARNFCKVLFIDTHSKNQGGFGMATQSFYEDLVLDTEEAVKNLEVAIEEADRRGPLNVEGAQGVDDDPEFIREIIKKYT